MNIPYELSLPDLWGAGASFKRDEWDVLTFLIGPNGSGKTRFAEPLKSVCAGKGLKVRYVSAERLVGLEREATPWEKYHSAFRQGWDISDFDRIKNYGKNTGYIADAFIVLREKLDIRLRVEAILGSLFGRRIRFAEEGGFLRPKIQRTATSPEYSLREDECHGLKEILALLAVIYDDDFNCLILDEPELHLHPQFQSFLMGEIRKAAGDPFADSTKKCFFLVTHSPYILDIRTLEELNSCLIFREDKPPVTFAGVDVGEKKFLERFLPRLNTHHKQFFFSPRPIFVEGYRDQQLFTLLQEARGKILGANGACFIDVGGKSEQEFFFRLTRKFEIESRLISDLDVLTEGRLRDAIGENPHCQKYITDHGLGANFSDAIDQLARELDAISKLIESDKSNELDHFRAAFALAKDTHAKRYIMLMICLHYGVTVSGKIPASAGSIAFVVGRTEQLRNACAAADVFLHPTGELENSLPSYTGDAFSIGSEAKDRVFRLERDFILDPTNRNTLTARYAALNSVLDKACGKVTVDLRSHVSFAFADWIGKLQLAFQKGELPNRDAIYHHGDLQWPILSRIVDIVDYQTKAEANGPASFELRLRLKMEGLPHIEFTVTDSTAHARFQLPNE